MKKALLFVLPLILVGCESNPKFDRVQKIPVYVTLPDELLTRCPDAPKLTEEEISSILTETDYNEKYVYPLWEAHDKCKTIINTIKEINEDAKLQNQELNNEEQ